MGGRGGAGRACGRDAGGGDERRAHVVAVRERRQALHVHAEQPRERICFSVTELGKFPSHVLDGAVPLTELYAGERAGRARRPHRAGRGCEPVAGQRPDQSGGARLPVVARFGELGGIPLLDLGDPLLRERGDRVVASRVRQEAQSVGGEVVVVGLESLVACFAHDVGPGRATPAAVAADGLAAADEAELDEVLEVPADGRGGQAKLVGERGCGDGAALADRLKDAVARARLQGVRRGRDVLALVFGDKHNTNVT